jgi:Zn-dependent metalloprotease
MIVRIAFILLCMLILGITGCSDPSFNDRETKTTAEPQNGFLNLDMSLPSDAVIKRDVKNETVIFLRGENLSQELEKEEHFRLLQSQNLFGEIVLAFLTAHRSVFRLVRPTEEFTVTSINTDDLGLKHVRFQQVFQGISVWASEIIVHLNQANQVYLMQGRYVPTPKDLNIHPALNETEAFRIVAEDLKNIGPDCRNCRSELTLFPVTEGIPRLAYRVLATPSLIEGWEYFIDAETGDILEKLTTVYEGGSPPIQMKERETDE